MLCYEVCYSKKLDTRISRSIYTESLNTSVVSLNLWEEFEQKCGISP